MLTSIPIHIQVDDHCIVDGEVHPDEHVLWQQSNKVVGTIQSLLLDWEPGWQERPGNTDDTIPLQTQNELL